MNTTQCVICRATIPAEGKHIHLCIVREGKKVVSREHVGFYDGMPICYRKFDAHSGLDTEAELDHYASDLARQTTIETADMAADRAERPEEYPSLQTPPEALSVSTHIDTPVDTLPSILANPGASGDILAGIEAAFETLPSGWTTMPNLLDQYRSAYGWSKAELDDLVTLEQLTADHAQIEAVL